jgi:hypothetical protein
MADPDCEFVDGDTVIDHREYQRDIEAADAAVSFKATKQTNDRYLSGQTTPPDSSPT